MKKYYALSPSNISTGLPASSLTFVGNSFAGAFDYVHLVNGEVEGAETADDCRLFCTLKGAQCEFYVHDVVTKVRRRCGLSYSPYP